MELRAPAVVATGVGAAYAALVAVRNPADGGPFLACPFHVVTGLWCPTCGATRGLHDLLHGDIGAALAACAPLVVLLPLLAYAWLTWIFPRLPSLARAPRPYWFAGVALLVGFGIVRNLPGNPLAP